MEIYALLAILIIVVYGLLTAYASYGQFKQGKIEPWPAVGMFVSALAMIGAGLLLGELSPFTLPLLLISVVALHALAAANGLHMHGKVNWRHQLLRGALSLVLVALTVLALNYKVL
jgi:hypothetical protein